MFLLGWFLALFGLVALLACGYLLVLTLFSARPAPAASVAAKTRFSFVVPSHDEEAGIGRTVADLLAVEYPRELVRLRVVADNCSDRTAEAARAAGAEVWERTDLERRGKGYALEMAFARILEEGWADAAVVIDADTVVSKNLLSAFDARLQAGARAVQADYGVQNPNAGWRTRLMSIALSMFHVLRARGRERLGVSAGLRGNGMCFSVPLLREVPHEAFSLVEDLEYGARLALAGTRVVYADEAHVYGEMVTSATASESQRRRWEGGRLLAARMLGPSLLREAVRRRSGVLADVAYDVFMLPLGQVVGLLLVGSVLQAGTAALGGPRAPLALWSAAWGCVAAYVVRGWWISGTGLRGIGDLLYAPVYLVWKLSLAVRGAGKPKAWVRTTREGRD